jgi:hypothetical protein
MKKLELNQIVLINGGACNGQQTADCISYNYNNNGWTSVLLWTATLIDPAIGIAVAAGCAAGVCIS